MLVFWSFVVAIPILKIKRLDDIHSQLIANIWNHLLKKKTQCQRKCFKQWESAFQQYWIISRKLAGWRNSINGFHLHSVKIKELDILKRIFNRTVKNGFFITIIKNWLNGLIITKHPNTSYDWRVQCWFQKFIREDTNLEDQEGWGCPSAIDDQHQKTLEENPHWSVREMSWEMGVSISTISDHLKKNWQGKETW